MSPAVQQQLTELLNCYPFDLVILTDNGVAGFAQLLGSTIPVLLLKHSVQAHDALDRRRRNGQFHPRWILEERLAQRFEAQTCRASTVVCCLNQQDVDRLTSRYQLSTSVVSIPLGVDLDRFPCRGNCPQTNVIGFTGNLSWGANVDGCPLVLP